MSLIPDSRPITAFIILGKELFQFKMIPFSLHSSATYLRLLNNVLSPDSEPHVLVYIDDIRIFDEQLTEDRCAFRRLRVAKLRLNPECFYRGQLRYLGIQYYR